MWYTMLIAGVVLVSVCSAQSLPPKEASAFSVRQIHSGHSLTDPLFYPHWPGQYVNLMGHVLMQPAWQLLNTTVGKSTIPGSSMLYRWDTPPGFGSPDARHDISSWELLIITERVPLLVEGGSTQAWYIEGIGEQREGLLRFVNNAWLNGNGGNGAPTLLWTTWVHVDGSSGNFREMLDVQGAEWERMQDHVNERRVQGSPPVYLIPGHRMMARLFDDVARGVVPGVTSIDQFFDDAIHTNELGAYAIALMHYACIFNRSPVGLPYLLLPDAPPGTLTPSPELAAYLQDMVWDVVTSYPRTGVSVATGLPVTSQSQRVAVYPNPATLSATVQAQPHCHADITVVVYDVQGVVVQRALLEYEGGESAIDVSRVPRGMYLVEITGCGESRTVPLFVQ